MSRKSPARIAGRPLLGASLAALALVMPAAHARQAAPVAASAPLSAPVTDAVSDPLARIRDEGINRSQVLQTASYLTDVIGPRLTNSPAMKRANLWAAGKLSEWGLVNAHQEAWGPFGRGWSLQKFSARMTGANGFPLLAYPKAWSPGIKGTLTAPVVLFSPVTEADLFAYKDKLRGAIVLNGAARPLVAHFDPQARRYTDDELLQLAARPDAAAPRPAASPAAPKPRVVPLSANRRLQFLHDAGAALLIDGGRIGDNGTVYVQSAAVVQPTKPAGASPAVAAPRRITAWSEEAKNRKIVPQVVLASEQYNRLVRMTRAGEPVRLAVTLDATFHDTDPMGYNTIAEIAGTEKNEVVMCGAHMDSWHTGTGATDNAAGVAVCMEAVRILKALNLPLRRTVRVALWSGEEQGLYGSAAYVAQHFGTVERGVLSAKPEQSLISAYFNLDNGTGKVRGVYAQSNDAVLPVFADWLKPFADLGATTVTIRNTGSTDHVSFDAVNIPGFQFIQDAIEYNTRTHHSNMDVFDRLQGDDLKQAAVLMAAFLYNTAQRDDRLPRKPLPTPPAQTPGAGAGRTR